MPTSPFFTLATYTILEGVRQRLLPLLGGVILLGLALATFAGSLAITEASQIRAGILGAFLRWVAVLLATFHLLHSQGREQDDKGLELLFSLPLSRATWFFGTLAGYGVLALAMALLFTGALLAFAPLAPVALWGISLFLEVTIVMTFAFLVQLTIRKKSSAALIVLLFYFLARALSSLQWVGQGAIMPQSSTALQVVNTVLDGVAFLLPGLDRFTQSAWLVYGHGGGDDLLFVLIQSVAYLPLLCGAALVDLYRKPL